MVIDCCIMSKLYCDYTTNPGLIDTSVYCQLFLGPNLCEPSLNLILWSVSNHPWVQWTSFWTRSHSWQTKVVLQYFVTRYHYLIAENKPARHIITATIYSTWPCMNEGPYISGCLSLYCLLSCEWSIFTYCTSWQTLSNCPQQPAVL